MLEEKFNKWLKDFKKEYKTIKPTMLDAFKDAYMIAIKDCLKNPKLRLTPEEIDNLINETLKKYN